jgi:hypothetical protein
MPSKKRFAATQRTGHERSVPGGRDRYWTR